MAGIYAADGTINVTVVDGTSRVNTYAADGSLNVQVSPGTGWVGIFAPCGALYITPYEGAGPTTYYAADGSVNMKETLSPFGGMRVTVISGALADTNGLILDNEVLSLDLNSLTLGA